MRGMKIAGVCLVAVFAFSAVAAASASAETAPTFVKCVKTVKVGGKYTGSYTNKTCTVKATEAQKKEGKKNKYELSSLGGEGHGLHVTVKKDGTTTITTKGVSSKTQVVVCSGGSFAGELYDSFASGKVAGTFTFTGCVGNKNPADKCGNSGAETIKYTINFGETLWRGAGETNDGVVLVGGPTFVCGGETVEIEGNVIGTVTPSSKGVGFAFKTNGANEQEDQDFWSEGSEVTEFEVTRWYTGGTHETTLKGSYAIAAKGVISR